MKTQICPYLSFNGQCETAFRFYEKNLQSLGGKILSMMTFEDSPMAEKMPANFRKKIIHATLAINDQLLSGSDSMEADYKKPQGFHGKIPLFQDTDHFPSYRSSGSYDTHVILFLHFLIHSFPSKYLTTRSPTSVVE